MCLDMQTPDGTPLIVARIRGQWRSYVRTFADEEALLAFMADRMLLPLSAAEYQEMRA